MLWLSFAFGVLIVVLTTVSLVSTFVLPRGGSRVQALPLLVGRGVRRGFLLLARPSRSFARKDGILAAVGPVSLIAQLAVFLALYVVGYGLMQWRWTGEFMSAIAEAGGSLFSVGLVHTSAKGSDVLVVLAGATGAVAVALQIGYLPAIYQAFNRRESLVTLMESRAGVPAWGPELLMRHQLVRITDALPKLYADWELWSADLAESHISYPVLMWFRSPEPGFSWVISLLAILDAAAMHLSLNPQNAPSEARMCLRMGFTALRRLARMLHWDFDADPAPEGELQLSYDEFAYAVQLVRETGFPVERTNEEAWPHFRGWRVNYESLAYRLADVVVAPRAPWSGERRHLPLELMPPKRPPHRAPDGKVFDDQKHRPSPG
ncbi:MAG: hypothetical protein ABSD97_09195 [Acidimicrobiales bacterium]|jgi:hypothetical protein